MKKINKKAQLIGESLTLFAVTVIVLGLLLVFFFMIKSIDMGAADAEQMKASSLEDSARSSLNAYIKTPVNTEYNGENVTMNMADLIRLAKIDDSHKKILEDESRKIFNEIYGANNYRLIVKDVFSIGRVEYIDTPSGEITIEKPQEAYTDESSSTLKLPDIEITLALKTG